MSEGKHKDFSPNLLYGDFVNDKAMCEDAILKSLTDFMDKYNLNIYDVTMSKAPPYADKPPKPDQITIIIE